MAYRFVHDQVLQKTFTTVGVDFLSKDFEVENNKYRVQIWDTAGEELFKSIAVNFYRECHGAIVCYDITSQKTFDHVPYWIGEVKKQAKKNAGILLVGTKSDLAEKRIVSKKMGEDLALKNGTLFAEVTSLDVKDNSVKEAVLSLIHLLVNMLKENVLKVSEIEQTFPGGLSQINETQPSGVDCCSK